MSPQQSSHFDPKTGVYSNTWPKPEAPKQALYDFVLSDVAFDDDRVAFTEHKPNKPARTITFGQLRLKAQQLGQGFVQKSGLKPGQVVMILSGNSIDFIVLFFALQFAGLTVALASPMYAAKELRHVYNLVQPQKVFLPLKLAIKASQGRFPSENVLSINANSQGTAIKSMWSLAVSEEEAKSAKPRTSFDQSQTAVLAFSSGTTGLPKAVMLSHKNIVAMLTILTCFPNEYAKPLRVLTTLPFFHALALMLHLILPVKTRGSVHIQVPFNPPLFLQLIVKEQIQTTTLVPPIMLAFAQSPHVNKQTFKSVISFGSGGAPLSKEVQNQLIDKTGSDVGQGYGMTETTVACMGFHERPSPGSVGRILPGVEAKLIDVDSGKPILEQGQRGELWVRGPNIFKGYHGNEKATLETMSSDGWLKTGDVALTNEQGEFFIVDRIKELIKYKGNQIAPAELEALINSHPKVAVAGVIGVFAKEQETEVPRAYVQLMPQLQNASPEEKKAIAKEVLEYVKKHASPIKWLRGGVVVVPQIPATPSGKLLRKDLRALAAKHDQAGAENASETVMAKL